MLPRAVASVGAALQVCSHMTQQWRVYRSLVVQYGHSFGSFGKKRYVSFGIKIMVWVQIITLYVTYITKEPMLSMCCYFTTLVTCNSNLRRTGCEIDEPIEKHSLNLQLPSASLCFIVSFSSLSSARTHNFNIMVHSHPSYAVDFSCSWNLKKNNKKKHCTHSAHHKTADRASD